MRVLRDVLEYVGEAPDNTASNKSWGDGEAKSHDAGIYKVKEIRVESFGGPNGSPVVEDLEELLRFPGLEKLYADSLDRSVSKGSGGEPGFVASSIEHLELDGCFAKVEDLEFILPACQGLRSLAIPWASKEDAHRRFDWRDLGECLAQYCPDLEHLRIDHTHDVMLDVEDTVEMGYGRD